MVTFPLVTIPFWQRIPSDRILGTPRWFGLTPPKSLHRAVATCVGMVVLLGVFGLEAVVVGLESAVVVGLESLPQPAIKIVAAAIRTPLIA